MNAMADNLAMKLREIQFLAGARGVLETPPVKTCDDSVIIFSMIGTRVVVPYLVAAKSLHRNLGRGRFAVLDDGTLTRADRDILKRHLDDPEVFSSVDVDTSPCPKGGCWERLQTLLGLRQSAYVIQLDSDTVTLGPVPEVAEAIRQGRNFTLRGEASSSWMPVREFAESSPEYDPWAPGTHVQDVVEALLPRIAAGLPEPAHYVRGCAGFAGFAPGGFDMQLARDFSREIEALVGMESWSRWGSEQVMSNVVVANEGRLELLPYERYLNFWNEPVPADAAFVHFIGTYRFLRGAYLQATRRAIKALNSQV